MYGFHLEASIVNAGFACQMFSVVSALEETSSQACWRTLRNQRTKYQEQERTTRVIKSGT